jgi:hypothetical protein
LQTIQNAKKRLEQRQAEEDQAKGRHEGDGGRPNGKKGKPFKRKFGTPPEKAQENFTDPESRIMKMGNGFEQCYNAQAAVDEEHQIIVAVGLTNCAADNAQLIPMIEATKEGTGKLPQQVLADAGYRSEENFEKTEAMNVDALVAVGREGRQDALVISPSHAATLRMKERLETPEGKTAYSRRKVIVEPLFGWIKRITGFREFSLRGQAKAAAEWTLVCLATNLRRMNACA